MNNLLSGADCHEKKWPDPFYKAVWEKAFAEQIPISGTFELTPRCNFNCRMCYIHLTPEQMARQGRELDAKEWIRIAEEAKEAGTVWICITGGEPLLHPEFSVIWKELSQMGFFITLQTNGSLIQGDILKLFEEYPPRNVKITLYGSNDEVYRDVCQEDGGFQKADRGIQNLKKRKIPVQLISTVIRQNEADVREMALYACKNRLPWAAARNIKASARGADSQAGEVRIKRETDPERRRELLKRVEREPMRTDKKPCAYCRDYRIGYWITWDGKMRFCSFMNEPDILVREQSFSESWKELLLYEETLEWPKECKVCSVQKMCRRCAGILAAECGSPHKVTEEFCSSIKQYLKGER